MDVSKSMSFKSLSIKSLTSRKDYQILDPAQESLESSQELEMTSSGEGVDDSSDSSSVGRTSPVVRPKTPFSAKMNAVFRKNLTIQKRDRGTTATLLSFPIVACLLLLSLQKITDTYIVPDPSLEGGCDCDACIEAKGEANCGYECTPKYSDMMFNPTGVPRCPELRPTKWPGLVQVPNARFRAVRAVGSGSLGPSYFADLPDQSCRATGSCPVTVLLTGQDRSIAERLGDGLWNETFSSPEGETEPLDITSRYLIGTDTDTSATNYFEKAFTLLGPPLYIIQPECNAKFSFAISIWMDGLQLQQDLKCIQGLKLWRDSSSNISNEIFSGYMDGNLDSNINEILGAYDFLNTNENKFNVTIWYNGTYKENGPLLRILRASNVASNSYLQFIIGSHARVMFDFVKEMPKAKTSAIGLDIPSTLGPLFFTWVLGLLFPVILRNLVGEKQDIRFLRKMQGLGDGSYWVISYMYFLLMSAAYVLFLVLFGSLVGMKIFRLNDPTMQMAFYFLFINLQIASGYFASPFISNTKNATVVAYLYVISSGLLGFILFSKGQFQGMPCPNGILKLMEILPGFSLYQGLHLLQQYSNQVNKFGETKFSWRQIPTDVGLADLLVIMLAEWPVLIAFGYYMNKVYYDGKGMQKHPLWFLDAIKWKKEKSQQNWQQHDKLLSRQQQHDIIEEREVVERSLKGMDKNYLILCDNIQKTYQRNDGSQEKHAVHGLSVAIQHGECFGLLGPDGSGKTTFINMMAGLTMPTSGIAYIQGRSIIENMDEVQRSMGFCSQHNIFWDTLTAREHLLFYGRLKNLRGEMLIKEVDDSLRGVTLINEGIADVLVRNYSDGMRRKLSVAVSLIGNPQVVYLDEPSKGLDLASKNNVWKALQVKRQGKTIIVATHSADEVEALCDRVGIIVNGSLQCLGRTKELKSRYGGFYVLTLMTPSHQENDVKKLACRLSPQALQVNNSSGVQTYHLPRHEVRISDVFGAVEKAKKTLDIQAWTLRDATLEDIFIKFARG